MAILYQAIKMRRANEEMKRSTEIAQKRTEAAQRSIELPDASMIQSITFQNWWHYRHPAKDIGLALNIGFQIINRSSSEMAVLFTKIRVGKCQKQGHFFCEIATAGANKFGSFLSAINHARRASES